MWSFLHSATCFPCFIFPYRSVVRPPAWSKRQGKSPGYKNSLSESQAQVQPVIKCFCALVIMFLCVQLSWGHRKSHL